jgi:uncharacterized protein (DUF1800 family)
VADTPPLPSLSPIAIYSGSFGVRQAERLLWRAGFGPAPGQAADLAARGLRDAVLTLTRPLGAPVLTGPEPTETTGAPLEPQDAYGDDALWWLDRMIRSDQPLVERMTLVWHDWFATSNSGVTSQRKMLDQNQLFRRHALGSFSQLVLDVSVDPAMMVWLNLIDSIKGQPNENYARELMELFTLGANREAYTEQDVRELARAFTGWVNHYDATLGQHTIMLDAQRHDSGVKTVFGHIGNWGWQEACRLCIEHPLHASFFVTKLWSYFIPTPPSESDLKSLEVLYRASGYAVRPIIEAILLHPDFYAGEEMVKPPAVYLAGLLRALRRGIDTTGWVSALAAMQQQLFYPPDVSGWNDSRWLDTSTMRGRWTAVADAIAPLQISSTAAPSYDLTETAALALQRARQFWGDPPLTADTVGVLLNFAETCIPWFAGMTDFHRRFYRAQRQNALRHLVAVSPDAQWS